jgi:hypothetical protein
MSEEVPVSHGTIGRLEAFACLSLLALWASSGGAQAPPAPTPRPPTAFFEGPDVSPNGLELSRFTVWSKILKVHRVGQQVVVTYSLKNTTPARIHFEGDGLALAVRVKSTGREEQRTVLPSRQVTELPPGYRELVQFAIRPDVMGKWHVSPVFVVGGRSAPSRWHELTFDVEAAPERPPVARQPIAAPRPPERIETLLGRCGDPGTLPHGLAATIWVRGRTSPRVGDTLKVQFTYQNLFPDQPALFGRKGVFAAILFTPKGKTEAQRRDFGHQLPFVVLRAYSPTRTIEFEESLLVDGAGTWVFWPSFEIDGAEAPERWCAVSVEVEE